MQLWRKSFFFLAANYSLKLILITYIFILTFSSTGAVYAENRDVFIPPRCYLKLSKRQDYNLPQLYSCTYTSIIGNIHKEQAC